MGVYIPNMEKPKDCRKCPRRIQYDDGWSVRNKCLELNRDIHYKYNDRVVMQDDCPLVEIVTCGKCMHKIQALSTEKGATGCELISGTFYGDFFCKEGEREADYTVFTVNPPKGIETPLKGDATAFHQNSKMGENIARPTATSSTEVPWWIKGE